MFFDCGRKAKHLCLKAARKSIAYSKWPGFKPGLAALRSLSPVHDAPTEPVKHPST